MTSVGDLLDLRRPPAEKTIFGYDLAIRKSTVRSGFRYEVSIPDIPSVHAQGSMFGSALRRLSAQVEPLVCNATQGWELPRPPRAYPGYHEDVARRLRLINSVITRIGFFANADDLTSVELDALENVAARIGALSRRTLRDPYNLHSAETAVMDCIRTPIMSTQQRALNLVGLWMKVDLLKDYAQFVEQGYMSFFSGEPIATAMVLAPVIEGVLLRWFGFSASGSRSFPKLSELLDFLAEQEPRHAQMIHPLMVEEYIRAFSKIYSGLLFGPHSNARLTGYFNRHYLAHLMGTGPFYRAANIFKLILLTDLLGHVVAACFGQHDRFHTRNEEFRLRADHYTLRFQLSLGRLGIDSQRLMREHPHYAANTWPPPIFPPPPHVASP